MYSVKRRRVAGVQVGCSYAEHKEQSTQCRYFKGSYSRVEKEEKIISYDDLLRNYQWDKDYTLSWMLLKAGTRNGERGTGNGGLVTTGQQYLP